MSNHCEDCGCRCPKSGICSNCHEEFYMITYQSGDFTEPLSSEFLNKADKQKQEIKDRKK